MVGKDVFKYNFWDTPEGKGLLLFLYTMLLVSIAIGFSFIVGGN